MKIKPLYYDPVNSLRARFMAARMSSDQTRTQASVDIGCGVSTIYELERNDKEPQHPLIIKAIEAYINKHNKKKER